MSLGEDERAVSIQVGAILLFGVLIILLATYQAFVVPDQNRKVEANHLETITTQMQELRDRIVSMPGSGVDRSVTLDLGTTYPPRVVAANPGPPAGAVRTRGTRNPDVNLTVAGAVATDAEVDDRWNGTNRTYATGALAYRPGYNEFRDAPTIVYDNTLLYHRFRSGNLTRAGQRVVDGNRLALVTVNGSLDTSATSAVSVDLRAESASDRRIAITNETGANVTVSFASRYNASQWTDELDGEFVPEGHVVGVTDSPIPGTGFDRVHVELEGDEVYTLGMAKVGVGTGVAPESVAYLAEVGGDARTIQEGSETTLSVEARDGLNNPVAGVTVNASIEPASQNGALDRSTAVTGEDGRATFEYDAAGVDGASPTFQVNFSYVYQPDGSFDRTAPENVSMNVTVQNTDGSGAGGGGGQAGFTVSWNDPSGQAGTGGCDSSTCILDASVSTTLDLTMSTSPVAEGASVDYAVNDTSTATLTRRSGTTNALGENQTTLSAQSNGPVKVYTYAGGSGDLIEIIVENFPVSTFVTEFDDEGSADEAGENDGIPPGTPDGDLANFANMQAINGAAASITEIDTLGFPGGFADYTLEFGTVVRSAPSGSSHQLSIKYRMQNDVEDVTVTVVDAGGSEIDPGTTYTLTGSGSTQTRSFALSAAEENYVNTNGELFLVWNDADPGDGDSTQLDVFYQRLLTET